MVGASCSCISKTSTIHSVDKLDHLSPGNEGVISLQTSKVNLAAGNVSPGDWEEEEGVRAEVKPHTSNHSVAVVDSDVISGPFSASMKSVNETVDPDIFKKKYWLERMT